MKPVQRLDELVDTEALSPGHSACAGCGAMIAVRQILMAAPHPLIVVNATGCVEVVSTQIPHTAWNIPYIHVAFENAAAVASGVEAALDVLEAKGLGRRHHILVLAGDGGTADIGLQALSGAFERGHRFVYVCYDNEAYMNTGIQRSSLTPLGAWSRTTPAGKLEEKKDLVAIATAHRIPYAATATIFFWKDLVNKVRKAFTFDGPSFIHVYAPCNRGWYFNPAETVRLSKLAVETRYFPLYEVERGVYRINYFVATPKPLEMFLKPQGRFQHLLKPENSHLMEALKQSVDRRWEELVVLSQRGKQAYAAMQG
ncbi:MAG: thiamine pyrophosphate-dependent enzyme [Candidatus Caldarchaeum sp.]|nr:thiamine pyrophosphate-dependent enzyme [Candidatus Caldarchaeum sp.]MDW8359743.1 thiamine pyrophosphate-dependent enzyme [Candidatus Caldarchaeum sp.]